MTVLDEIIEGVREDLDARKQVTPLDEIILRAQETSFGLPIDVLAHF